MPAKKKAVKKTAAKKTTKKAVAVKKKVATRKKAVAKKSTAKKSSVKKAAPKKAAAKKVTAKKKAAPKKAAARKAAPKKSVKKATAKKAVTKKAATRKAPAKKKQARKDGAAEGVSSFTPYKTKRGEEYMGEPMKVHFRELLINWKKELMEEVDRTVHHMQDDAANFPDPNDRASQESEFTLELRTRDRERKLIKKIDESLNLLDEDEYGFCESCGVEIGVRRLEARPTATLCIDCKTLDEIREKQKG